MAFTKPFGNLDTALILVIGHDPRLQRSKAEAEVAFFLDYLSPPRPTRRAEARKYELASALLSYISYLTGREVSLYSLYVTNLCNEFLPSTKGHGIVLIPNEKAAQGAAAIQQALSKGDFRIILPMSQQVNFQLEG